MKECISIGPLVQPAGQQQTQNLDLVDTISITGYRLRALLGLMATAMVESDTDARMASLLDLAEDLTQEILDAAKGIDFSARMLRAGKTLVEVPHGTH